MSSFSLKPLPVVGLLWAMVFTATFAINSPSFVALLVRLRKDESLATITQGGDPQNHNYITYEYTVKGKTFSALGYGPNHKEMRVADQVRVQYFPAYPKFATISSDAEQNEELKDGVIESLFVATAMVFLVYWKQFRTK